MKSPLPPSTGNNNILFNPVVLNLPHIINLLKEMSNLLGGEFEGMMIYRPSKVKADY
jgi:hypothetical protein